MEHGVRRLWAALVVTAAIGITACSGSGEDDSRSESAVTVAAAADAADTVAASAAAEAATATTAAAADTTAAAATSGSGGGLGVPEVDETGTTTPGVYRAVIATAELSVTVADVASAAAAVREAAVRAGGYVASSEESAEGDGGAVVTIKVPPGDFDRLLDDLGGLGTVERRQIDSQDVTDQVVDLDARIAVMKAGVQRLTDLIADTNNLNEIATLEAELTRRTADLESVEGQLRVLSSQVSLSTITVTLQPVVVVAPDPIELVGEVHTTPSFVDGLRSGWDAFVDAARVTSVVIGAALPWLIPAVPAVLMVLVIRRRMRHAPVP